MATGTQLFCTAGTADRHAPASPYALSLGGSLLRPALHAQDSNGTVYLLYGTNDHSKASITLAAFRFRRRSTSARFHLTLPYALALRLRTSPSLSAV